jgi:hypothetical protein
MVWDYDQKRLEMQRGKEAMPACVRKGKQNHLVTWILCHS